jgi:hypothetical protein
MDEEGIISKDDSKVLVAARKLQKLLRKVNFPSSFNPQIRNPTKVSERCGPNRQECDFSSSD